jgi:hypothetical protein
MPIQRYRSVDERVLQHIVNNANSNEQFVSRTRARYGMLSVSAPEFDLILERHKIDTHYDERTRGQQYKVEDVVNALARLKLAYEKVGESFVFEPAKETKPDEALF